MSMDDPLVASVFGALDSAISADGKPLSTHALRKIAMTANKLYGQGEPLLVLPFSQDNNAILIPANWVRLYSGPIPCLKKPYLNRAEAKFVAAIDGTNTIYCQIGTSARPFDPLAVLDNQGHPCFAATGSAAGAMQSFATWIEIPLGPDDVEWIDIWVRGLPSAIHTAESDGMPNIGRFVDFSATTLTVKGASFAAGVNGSYVHFIDSAGNSSTITRQINSVAGEVLGWATPLAAAELLIAARGAHFELRLAARSWRPGALSIYTRRRTV